MTADEVEAMFSRKGAGFAFARWGRPIVPVIFGVEDSSLAVLKGAIEAVVTLAGHQMAETDPELGANLMVFFVRDWRELTEVPNMADLVADLTPLVARLDAEGANQYRMFRFDERGAIRAAFVFLKMTDDLAALPAATLALGQMVQVILLWSDRAFSQVSPLARPQGSETAVLKPQIAALIRAAYDPVLPAATREPSHALRLVARMQVMQ